METWQVEKLPGLNSFGKVNSLGKCMSEINLETLIAYLRDELTAVDRAVVETYIQQSPHGREQLAEAQQLLDGLRANADDLATPSTSLFSRAQAAFRQQMKRVAARPSERPSRPADVQFDSWAQPTPLGARGVGGGLPERQLLFHEGEYDLDLQIVAESAANAVTMRGQLLRGAGSNVEAQELEGIALNLRQLETGEERRGLTDGYGRFAFSHVAKGDYLLSVALHSHDMLIHLDAPTSARPH